MSNISARFGLAIAYFSASRDYDIDLLEMLSGIFKLPCTILGPKLIRSLVEKENYQEVWINGVDTPLLWPKSVPLFDLYKVITESFYPSDWHFYEIAETTVQDGDWVFDCGAAEGIFALRVLSRAGRIIAFEPLPMFVKSMSATFATQSKVTIVPSALGNTVGEALLEGDSLYGHVSQTGTTAIPITTIDQWVSNNGARVDYIKGDLEGFELKVLEGAIDSIDRFKPRIAITTYHPENEWRKMVQLVQNIDPAYQFRVKGIAYNDRLVHPVMLHMWHPSKP